MHHTYAFYLVNYKIEPVIDYQQSGRKSPSHHDHLHDHYWHHTNHHYLLPDLMHQGRLEKHQNSYLS